MRFAIHERSAQVPGYAYEGTIGNDDVVPLAGDRIEIDGIYHFLVESRTFAYESHGGPLLTLNVSTLSPASA